MMGTGGYHAAPRRHGSRLAGPHPCLPPAGEGEEARGEESHLSHPHPCPLPQAGEGVHTKFIASSACCMGVRGILHDENPANRREHHWCSINRSLVQPFLQHQIHNPLLSLIRSHAMVFLEKVCYPDHCLGPFLVALAPGVGGDALPRIAIKKRGIHKMVQGSHPCTASISFSKQANPPQQQVTQNRQGNNGTHQ